MTSFELSTEAELDYFFAFDYLDGLNPRAAARWEARMLDAFDRLVDFPLAGRIRPEFAPHHLRVWIAGEYAVIYDPSSDPLYIVAILHGAQDIHSIMDTRISFDIDNA